MTQERMDQWWAQKQAAPPAEEWDEEDPTEAWMEESVALLQRAARIFKALTEKGVPLKKKLKGMTKLLRNIQQFTDEVGGEVEDGI